MSPQEYLNLGNLDKLFVSAQSYKSSKKYYDMLKMCGRFRRLSPFNAMLINIQKPMARYVLSEEEWLEEFHRNIKPNAQPLVILVPFGPVDFL